MSILRSGLERVAGKSGLAGAPLLAVVALVNLAATEVQAGPSAETAKKCLRYSYIAFPYQRPGAVRMSGDRQAYFKDCMDHDGNVPQPSPPKS